MSAATPRFLIGDPIAHLAIPDLAGNIVDFRHQERSARTLILVLARGVLDLPAGLADLAQSDPSGEITVAVALSDPPTPDAAPAGTLMLSDRSGDVSAAFGVRPPAIVVIGADTRLKGVFDGHDLAGARSLADRLAGAGDAQRILAQAPVALIEGVFEPDLCRRLISYWTRGRQASNIVSSGRAHSDAAATVKKRTDVVVEDRELVAVLRHRLERRVIAEIKTVFQVEIVRHEALRIGCYDGREGGYFRPHRDNATPYTRHRRFALTANLNDGYAGGELHFPEYGRMLYRPPPGGTVIFSCSLLHQALPVTEGRRFALLTFFTDRAGAEEERMLAARMGLDGPAER